MPRIWVHSETILPITCPHFEVGSDRANAVTHPAPVINSKAVSEWFPRHERGWAVALFDSGSAVGAAVAPLLVLGLYKGLGSWRAAFAVRPEVGASRRPLPIRKRASFA